MNYWLWLLVDSSWVHLDWNDGGRNGLFLAAVLALSIQLAHLLPVFNYLGNWLTSKVPFFHINNFIRTNGFFISF